MKQSTFSRMIILGVVLAVAFGTGMNAHAKKKSAPASQIVTGVVEVVNIKTDTIQFKATDKTYTCRVAADAQIVTLTNPLASLGDVKVGDTIKVNLATEMGKPVTHKIEQTKAAPQPAPAQ